MTTQNYPSKFQTDSLAFLQIWVYVKKNHLQTFIETQSSFQAATSSATTLAILISC